ncbi:MAG: hypothetical protein AB7F22_33715 [Reyranella sp.]|uniref:hypothetical protein n=1 Tax=Reyranella sp. TaxID=1929291 RepID=UPI003D109EF2
MRHDGGQAHCHQRRRRAAIYALDGILAALDWLDEGWLDDKVDVDQLKAARTNLIAAGKLLCERTAELL